MLPRGTKSPCLSRKHELTVVKPKPLSKACFPAVLGNLGAEEYVTNFCFLYSLVLR